MRVKSYLSSFVFCCVFALSPNCTTSKHQINLSEEWSDHSELALSISEAILQGMRELLDQLLISQEGFDDLFVTINSENQELLRAKILHFHLSDPPQKALFSTWNIYLVSSTYMDYANSLHFESTPNPKNARAVDSLTVDVYTPSVNQEFEDDMPSFLELVFWRNLEKRDRLAILRMRRTSDDQFTIER